MISAAGMERGSAPVMSRITPAATSDGCVVAVVVVVVKPGLGFLPAPIQLAQRIADGVGRFGALGPADIEPGEV